ncbi:MAG: hypothetical protein ACK4R6_02165 [Spirosomataceae bacterium]
MKKDGKNKRGQQISNVVAKKMQAKWQERKKDKKVAELDLPNGFFLDKESIEFLLSQGKDVDGIAVTFGVDEENKMAVTVYAVKSDLTPVQAQVVQKSSEGEQSFVVYDMYGTCCPK